MSHTPTGKTPCTAPPLPVKQRWNLRSQRLRSSIAESAPARPAQVRWSTDTYVQVTNRVMICSSCISAQKQKLMFLHCASASLNVFYSHKLRSNRLLLKYKFNCSLLVWPWCSESAAVLDVCLFTDPDVVQLCWRAAACCVSVLSHTWRVCVIHGGTDRRSVCWSLV